MKEKLIAAMIAVCIVNLEPSAKVVEVPEPKLMRVTCYTSEEDAYTSSGYKVRRGICAGPEYLQGCCVVLYDSDMTLIGYWEILDTGSHKRLNDGSAIDIWLPTLEECNEWIATYGDYCYCQIIRAKG